MQEKWDIPVEEYDAGGEKADDALGFEVGDMLAAVSLADCPIPGGEANAENNYMWEDAVKAAREHRAHLLVAVLGTDADPNDPRDFLASLASYVLENDVELRDGETIGFTADDKHAITRSPGVGLPEEQMTLKISWRSGGDGPDEGGDDPDDGEDDVVEMDDGAFHLETIQEKSLPVDEINAYNHMAIYLRWCMEHEYLCPALRGHIQYFAASYSKSADHEGRAAIRMDGVEVLRSNYYTYFENVWTKFHHLRSTTLKDHDSTKEAIDRAHAYALEQGTFDQKVFYEAFGIFDNQSIEKSLVSENPLVRIFALLDRRLGKRRLLALEDSMEQELDWVRAFYVIRLQAEGLMEANNI